MNLWDYLDANNAAFVIAVLVAYVAMRLVIMVLAEYERWNR